MDGQARDRQSPDRRDFLKTAGALTAGAVCIQGLDGLALPLFDSGAEAVAPVAWRVRPFALTQVTLGDSLFQQKRDRMLELRAQLRQRDRRVRGTGSRCSRNFRFNAGLDTKGAQPPGSWENGDRLSARSLRRPLHEHAGAGVRRHGRRDLQDRNSTTWSRGSPSVRTRSRPPRAGRRRARRASSTRRCDSPDRRSATPSTSRCPRASSAASRDFTIAVWINLALYDRALLSDSGPNAESWRRSTTAPRCSTSAIRIRSSAQPPLARMFLTVRASNEQPVPRFAITTSGADGEQRIDGTAPLADRRVDARRGDATRQHRRRCTSTARRSGTNATMTLAPADLGATTGNWIGRGQFPQRNVSYLNAAVDEFQIFDRALDARPTCDR